MLTPFYTCLFTKSCIWNSLKILQISVFCELLLAVLRCALKFTASALGLKLVKTQL